jgi:hypothetical protein
LLGNLYVSIFDYFINSSIDLSDPAESIKDVPHLDVLLQPGQCLFIPRWWWHFITSIDHQTASRYVSLTQKEKPETEFSFSINFWWGKRTEREEVQ